MLRKSWRRLCAQVLAAGPEDWVHPASRKAKLWVKLRDLMAETGLTDLAAQHVALVCGPRRAARPSLAVDITAFMLWEGPVQYV